MDDTKRSITREEAEAAMKRIERGRIAAREEREAAKVYTPTRADAEELYAAGLLPNLKPGYGMSLWQLYTNPQWIEKRYAGAIKEAGLDGKETEAFISRMRKAHMVQKQLDAEYKRSWPESVCNAQLLEKMVKAISEADPEYIIKGIKK